MKSIGLTRFLVYFSLALLTTLGSPASSNAAKITIINGDGSGEGFNDVTEVPAVGGNTGVTLGQQRLIAAQWAADIWGDVLDSDVEIFVAADFKLLPCSAQGALLGFAGPNCSHMNFIGAPFADTLYPAALANKLFGADLCPADSGCACPDADISATFSASLDVGCSGVGSWYYGLDGQGSDGQLDFVTVFLHELGHGLGFLTYVDLATGKKLQDLDDHFMRNLEEHASGLTWQQMSFNVQRKASAIDNFGLHWIGPDTVESGSGLQMGRDEATGHVYMYAPETLQLGSSVSHFDISVYPNELMEPFYTGPNHDIELAAKVFVDVGWGPLRPPGICGDGVVDIRQGEKCDDAGESPNCDSDCTLPSCGDGTPNAAAGEECDDGGESELCDPDCSLATCGDGYVNTTAGEICDDEGETVACDTDCTRPACGDGLVNSATGETCDDGGSSATCDSDCTAVSCGDGLLNIPAGEECDDGGESADCDSDCSAATCGDGTLNVTAGEVCDDGVETATCDSDCTPVVCGDGLANASAGEDCDDGNAIDGDGCDTNCTITACGNGIVTAGEDCDDAGESLSCDADCTVAFCGDSTINTTAGESCDDGGESASCDSDCSAAACGDGLTNVSAGESCDDAGESASCNADCSIALCGDGIVNASAGETCDDSNVTDGDGCDSNCTPTACGNGAVSSGEACDDGNLLADDGCDAACALESGWDCAGAPTLCSEICGDALVVGSEDCEDGNSVDGDGCDSNCTFTGCGNGIVTAGEECDDGGESASCDSDCTVAQCGDGTVNAAAGEECDDGGESASCDLDCTVAQCGDGDINASAGEICDDANLASGDGCDANCTPSACGNGVKAGDESCDDGNNDPDDGCSPLCECQLLLCGDPNYTCDRTASDAFRILQSAVGIDVVCATWTCDVDSNGMVSARDALAILRKAVNIPVATQCGTPNAVTFYLNAASTALGSIQFEVDYTGAAGDFVGDGPSVACTNLLAASTAAFNKMQGRVLAMDFINLEGFSAPLSLARCEFAATGELQIEDFQINISEAANTLGQIIDTGELDLRGYPY